MIFFKIFFKSSKKKILLAGMSLIFLLTSTIVRGQDLETNNITLNVNDVTLENALAEIERQSKLAIFYGEDIDKYASTRVSVIARNISVNDAISRVLSNTNLTYTQRGNQVMISEKPVASTSAPKGGKGSVSGTVLDESGAPVIGAMVGIPGTTTGTTTDIDGKYSLTGVAEGTRKVQFSFMGYETLLVDDVKINANRSTPLDVVLKESTTQLNDVVITATYNQASANGMYAAQKLNSSLSDGISSDLIKKTSDNNVAQVLKRVAGVTINDGKFVTVRGMSERYNNVQLNGSSLPSTEPNSRNFSFDIIPSNLIENVIVRKTFTPDQPGEFTGGLVQVRTLSIPDEKFLSLSAGTGMNTISTGKEFQTNKRFASDYLFGEINRRSWYVGHTEEQVVQSQNNAAQINHYGFYKYKAAPQQNYSLSFGLPIQLNWKHSLGLIGAVTYRHEETRENIKDVHTVNRDSLVRGMSDHFNHKYKFATAIGAVLNIGWKTTDHAITWRNLYNSRFTHSTLNRMMHDYYDNGMIVFEVYSTPLQSLLMQTQLDGEHAFFNKRLKITWSADYNKTSRTNPDDRFAQAGVNDRGINVPNPSDTYLFSWPWSTGTSNPYISSQFVMHNRLDETKDNEGINVEYAFTALKNEQKLKAGFHRSFRRAKYDQQYLHAFIERAPGFDKIDGTSLHDFYDPVNFDNGFLYYKSSGFSNRQADFYEGEQTIMSAYLMGEFNPFKPLRIIGGVRMENAVTKTLTHYSWYTEKGYNATDSLFKRTDLEWLPSVTAIYAITPKLNLRAAYAQTLARPDFRELTAVTYYNVEERIEIEIEKPVEESMVKNVDLRLEWYPAAGEVISISAFYKDFDKPVEKVIRVKSDLQNFVLQTVNLERSILWGFEFNLRKSFGFIHPTLNDLWLSGNASIIQGNVEIDNGADGEFHGLAKRARPLQGLAPYSANVSLAYEGKVWGAALNYTRVGRTLIYGGDVFAKYDQYENPRNVLDLQLSARLLKQKMEIKLNVSDFLNEDIIVYRNHSFPQEGVLDEVEKGSSFVDRTALGLDYNEGDYLMSRISKGINLSLSVSYKF